MARKSKPPRFRILVGVQQRHENPIGGSCRFAAPGAGAGVNTNHSAQRTTTFRARRGQIVHAWVESKTRGFYPLLFITSPSGRNLTQSKNTSYSAQLRETGLYRVRVGVNFMATQTTSGATRLFVRVR